MTVVRFVAGGAAVLKLQELHSPLLKVLQQPDEVPILLLGMIHLLLFAAMCLQGPVLSPGIKSGPMSRPSHSPHFKPLKKLGLKPQAPISSHA